DSLLFFKASKVGAREICSILHIYCATSGQRINLDKSLIHFAKGCRSELKEEIKGELEVHNEALSERYLGMPTDVGSSINGSFQTECGRRSRDDGIMFIIRREGSLDQISGPGSTYVLNVLLQATKRFVQTSRKFDEKFLVGKQGRKAENLLGCLGGHDETEAAGWSRL
ncbi:hypothetical protein U9M48_012025, partial [Paspalum notatum var. saurae]